MTECAHMHINNKQTNKQASKRNELQRSVLLQFFGSGIPPGGQLHCASPIVP